MARPVLEGKGLEKSFPSGAGPVKVLRGVHLSVEAGEFLPILGVSGCGKSTLLHCLGLLESPDAGEVVLDGRPASSTGAAEQAHLRNARIGFIFQAFHLSPELSALENVMLPARIARSGSSWLGARREILARAESLLDRVGLTPRAAHRPAQLSGGERQRVAVARSLMNRPAVLLADEPTGNLDSQSGEGIIRLLEDLAKEGAAVLVVTHNEALGRRARRAVRMTDGLLTEGI